VTGKVEPQDGWWVPSIAKALAHGERLAILQWLHADRDRELTPRGAYGTVPTVRRRMPHYQLLTLAQAGLVESLGPRRFEGSSGPMQAVYTYGRSPNAGLVAAVIELADGRRQVVNSAEGIEAMKLTDAQVVKVAKALGHPLRLRLIRDLQRFDDYAPSRWAEDNELPLGNVDYHFKTLAKLGVAKVIRTERRRGATEHHYGLAGKLAAATVTALDVLEDRAELVPVRSKKSGRRSKATASTNGRERAAAGVLPSV
jgi:DNA-binding transcriptional ArsR family regulator